MLRIPNPGSDVATFVRVFRELFDALRDFRSFDHDDMAEVLVDRNLMTSSGYMGPEALARGYRDDRSLDGPYNQSKMYSELLRVLGWIHPLPGSKGDFKFTHFGEHVAASHRETSTILDESLLAVTYPNPFVAAKAQVQLRPFAAMLFAAGKLDGILSRDEMIIGPLCLTNDRDTAEWTAMIEMSTLR